MENVLTLFVNDQAVFEYDRETVLDDQQLEFLDKMDADMDGGIKIRGELFSQPDLEQRSRFMVMNLIKALKQEDDAKIAVSCAYLTNRQPELIEIRVNDEEADVAISLVNEQL